MPTAGGPNTLGESNLVFAYDTGDVSNSYLGEPTVNLTTDAPSLYGWQGGYTVENSSTKTFLLTTQQDNAATPSAWRTTYWSVSAYIGSYVTISADVEFVSETNCTFSSIAIGQGNTGSFPLHIEGSNAADKVSVYTKPVNRIRMTWSGIINSTGIVGFTQWINNVTVNGANSVLRVINVQIEAKSHTTPFVAGTRSATQGLLPLIGNSTIDLSNVSFDSSAQLIWDGTDDTLAISDTVTHKPNTSFTYEIVFKPLGGGTFYDKMLIGKPGWHTGIMYQYSTIWFRTRYGSPAFYDTSGYSVTQGNYYHAVATYTSNTSMKFYVNGTLIGENNSVTTPLFDIGNTLNIGGNSVNYSSYVEIPVVRNYNKALSAQEVRQNYQQYKTRFNLS